MFSETFGEGATILHATCTFLVHDPNRLRVPVDLARTRSKSRSTGTILIVPVPVS